jgi:hypothetical protein
LRGDKQERMHGERGVGWGKQWVQQWFLDCVGWIIDRIVAIQGVEQFIRHTGEHVGVHHIQQHCP